MTIFDQDLWSLFTHSISLAGVAAILALLLALLIGYINWVYKSAFTVSVVRFISMGYALPGTVIAIGVLTPITWFDAQLVTFFEHYLAIDFKLLLSGSLVILVFAYLVRYIAVSLGFVESALTKLKPSLDEAARVIGMSSVTILKNVHLPIMKGSLLAAVLLVFVDVLKELPATLILRPFNFNTLAIRTYELANEERLAEVSLPALAIVLAGVIPVFIISKTISRPRPW